MAFTGTIDYNGKSICVHYQRLKADRPTSSTLSPLPKHEHKKTDPGTYNPQDNDLVVGLNLGTTNVITIVAPKRLEDGADGNLCQSDMRRLKFSRAR